jgi:hypothetical protein
MRKFINKQIFESSIWHPYPNIQIWTFHFLHKYGKTYCIHLLTINVPLFKKLRDIIFFGGENHFMSHIEGHFEGAKTFLTP